MCCRGEFYPTIYTGSKAVLGTIHGVRTKLHCLSMEACHRLTKERIASASRGSGTPRVGRTLTASDDHCLWSVGSWLDLEYVPVVPLVQSLSLDGALYVCLV